MTTVRHNEYVIGLPDGWVDGSQVVLAGQRRGEVGPTITISREVLAQPATASSYASSQLPVLRDFFGPDALRVVEDKPIIVASLPAYQRTYELQLAEGSPPMMQRQVYVVRKDVAYTITATEDVDHFPEIKTKLDQALSGFRFVDIDQTVPPR